jgi:hypothetical protein
MTSLTKLPKKEITHIKTLSTFQARGSLLSSDSIDTHGRLLVKLKIDDDMSKYGLPLGSAAEIAVYSEHLEHVSLMRKILIRMKSWQNYLYLDH